MKRLLLLLLLPSYTCLYAQKPIIYVRFTDELVMYIASIYGYDFTGDYNFVIENPFMYETIKSRVDSLIECPDSCKLPDVRRQIILRHQGERSYDVVSFNKYMMEKNGKPVYFDAELYNIIDVFVRDFMKKNGIPDLEEELWKMFYKKKG